MLSLILPPFPRRTAHDFLKGRLEIIAFRVTALLGD